MSVNLTGGLPLSGEMSPLGLGQGAQSVSPGRLDGTSVARFEDALRAAQGADVTATQGVQVAQVQGTGTVTDAVPPVGNTPLTAVRNADAVDGATAPDPQSAADRAARGLDLDPVARADEGPGTTILSGLERLRGVFDSQITSVHQESTGATMDVVTMMNIQAEVVQYSVLVDVTSKLAGKSTQALDSLMKGQ
jgi:type III secretion system YscI/HrpB-like protein